MLTLDVATPYEPADGYNSPSPSSSSSSSCSSSECEYDECDGCDGCMSPRGLLTLAIQRRRVVYNSKERDLRRELLHTSLIQSLCKHLGERRAKRRHQRRATKRHRMMFSREYRKREYSSSDNGFLDQTPAPPLPPGIDRDDFLGYVGLAGAPGGEGGGETGQFDGGYNDGLYSLLQQDNCVQFHMPKSSEAETQYETSPSSLPSYKKSRYAEPDADPFGLDALFDELYGSSAIASGCGGDKSEIANGSHETAVTVA